LLQAFQGISRQGSAFFAIIQTLARICIPITCFHNEDEM